MKSYNFPMSVTLSVDVEVWVEDGKVVDTDFLAVTYGGRTVHLDPKYIAEDVSEIVAEKVGVEL